MKVRNMLCVLVCAGILGGLTACGSGDGSADSRAGNGAAGVEEVLEQGISETDAKDSVPEDEPSVQDSVPEEEPSKDSSMPVIEDAGEVDVDLTSMSATRVYSEVYNMMTVPEDYIGKRIMMDGLFTCFHDANAGKYYFACIVEDATACCAQGIEFVLSGDHSYPEDYPEEGGRVAVVGTFSTYEDGDATFCTLTDAQMAY